MMESTIEIFYWANQKFDDLPWEHGWIFKHPLDEVLDIILDSGYHVMVKKDAERSAMTNPRYFVYVDTKRFTQR